MTFFPLKTSTISLLLLLAIASSAWSILLSKHNKQSIIDHSVSQADIYMENIMATIINKNGTPSLKIESPKIIHYSDNSVTYIIHPHVTIYRESPKPWYINADYARAIHGMEKIVFSNNVIIYHPVDKKEPKTTMTTTSLTVFPDKQQASTDQAVTITQPDTVVHAVGMLANLQDGTVQLLSQAKGDYVPS